MPISLMEDEHANTEFWMVWCPQGDAPTHKHCTAAEAANEAERLARKCKGKRFFVLHAIEVFEANDVQRTRLEEFDESPF